MWEKYITRRLAVQVAQSWNFGWGKAMQKVYGTSLMGILVYRDRKKTEYYVDKEQHEKYVSDLYRLLRDDKFIKEFHGKARNVIEKILKDAKKKFSKNLSKLSNKELCRMYESFVLPNTEQFYVRMWAVFNLGEPLANVIREDLKRYAPDDKIDVYMLNLATPLVPNDVMNERIDLLKLNLLNLSSRQLESRIKQHTQKYRHIPMFDFDHEPYDEAHFMGELKSIKNPEKELQEIKELFAGRKKDFNKVLKILNPDNKLMSLLHFLKDSVFLRDYRDMIRQKLNLELRGFYEEVGKRLGLRVDQVAILTNDEIIGYLKKSKKFPLDIIKKRESSYLLIQKGSKVEIYSGIDADKKAEKELYSERLDNMREIKGAIGSMGFAKGTVRIVYTNKDLLNVKKGDVLVATMTRQDFVSAMRKAVAVVTDEGNVTCHAAIIARELKIPCIVAAKIATKILKDGDIVEVDANKGIVRKL